MTEKQELKVRAALDRHARGYNCAQAVACSFCEEAGIDEETMFRVTEGMGLGMGCMDGTCGAIGAAAVLAGLKNSTGHLEHPDSKAISYKASKKCLTSFKERNSTVICRDLKGIGTGKVLQDCETCVASAAEIIARELYQL